MQVAAPRPPLVLRGLARLADYRGRADVAVGVLAQLRAMDLAQRVPSTAAGERVGGTAPNSNPAMPITSPKRFSLNNLKHCFHKTKRTIARMQSTTKTTELTIHDSFVIVQIPCLIDNYAFLIHCLRTKQTCALDTPELNPILSELLRRRWTLTHILNTHWHGDHTGANLQVRSKTLTLTLTRTA